MSKIRALVAFIAIALVAVLFAPAAPAAAQAPGNFDCSVTSEAAEVCTTTYFANASGDQVTINRIDGWLTGDISQLEACNESRTRVSARITYIAIQRPNGNIAWSGNDREFCHAITERTWRPEVTVHENSQVLVAGKLFDNGGADSEFSYQFRVV